MAKAGVPQCDIAKSLGISKGAIWRALRRENIHHTQESPPRIGRTPKLDSMDLRRLAREIVTHPGKPWDYFARRFNVSSDVIRKIATDLHSRRPRVISMVSEDSWITSCSSLSGHMTTAQVVVDLSVDVLPRPYPRYKSQ
jgi:DNA invertase Pin-like site-specific DNA recombinase